MTPSPSSGPHDPDKIIAAVNRGHQALEFDPLVSDEAAH